MPDGIHSDQNETVGRSFHPLTSSLPVSDAETAQKTSTGGGNGPPSPLARVMLHDQIRPGTATS